jgi:hypothetical protein
MHFDHFRLPELFAGFSRKHFGVPVHYPVACHPQAWAAGSVPYMITTLLGLEPHGFDNLLLVRRPILPNIVDCLEVRGLRVGKGGADLRFTRQGRDIEADVLRAGGGLDVQVRYTPPQQSPEAQDVEQARQAEPEKAQK